MFVKLPSLAILATITDSKRMYIHPDGHMLFTAIPPDDDLLLFVVEEDLNALSEDAVNDILQREILGRS